MEWNWNTFLNRSCAECQRGLITRENRVPFVHRDVIHLKIPACPAHVMLANIHFGGSSHTKQKRKRALGTKSLPLDKAAGSSHERQELNKKAVRAASPCTWPGMGFSLRDSLVSMAKASRRVLRPKRSPEIKLPRSHPSPGSSTQLRWQRPCVIASHPAGEEGGVKAEKEGTQQKKKKKKCCLWNRGNLQAVTFSLLLSPHRIKRLYNMQPAVLRKQKAGRKNPSPAALLGLWGRSLSA